MEARSLSLSDAPQNRDAFRLDGKVAVVTAAAQEIAASGGDAKSYACDISDQAHAREAFDKLARQERLDILVNNAGVSHIGTVETTSEADFDRLFRINVKGVYNCTYAAIGHM